MNSFRFCAEPNDCIKLKNGRLFKCVRPAVIDRFNEFFNAGIEVCDEDYIDIYEVTTGQEVLDWLAAGPIPFCRYCDMRGRDYGYEWKKSDKRIEEWIYSDSD